MKASRRATVLVLQRRLLVTQASLQRLQLQQQVQAIDASWRPLALAWRLLGRWAGVAWLGCQAWRWLRRRPAR